MKVILAGLGLLPVIACHVYLQLPPLAAGYHSPLGLRQRHPKDPEGSMRYLQSPEALLFRDSLEIPQETQLTLHHNSNTQRLQDLESAVGQDVNEDFNLLFPGSLDDRIKMLTKGKRSDYESGVRLPDVFSSVEKNNGAGESSLSSPSSRPLHNISLQPLLALGRIANTKIHRANTSTDTRKADPPVLGGDKRSPSKRYLGIELPDYIASNYGADKSNNMKLHNLKQRMRSVGK